MKKASSFADSYAGSIYGEAASYSFNGGKEAKGIASYFLEKDKSIMNYGYLLGL